MPRPVSRRAALGLLLLLASACLAAAPARPVPEGPDVHLLPMIEEKLAKEAKAKEAKGWMGKTLGEAGAKQQGEKWPWQEAGAMAANAEARAKGGLGEGVQRAAEAKKQRPGAKLTPGWSETPPPSDVCDEQHCDGCLTPAACAEVKPCVWHPKEHHCHPREIKLFGHTIDMTKFHGEV